MTQLPSFLRIKTDSAPTNKTRDVVVPFVNTNPFCFIKSGVDYILKIDVPRLKTASFRDEFDSFFNGGLVDITSELSPAYDDEQVFADTLTNTFRFVYDTKLDDVARTSFFYKAGVLSITFERNTANRPE